MDFSVYLRDEESPPIATKWCRRQVQEMAVIDAGRFRGVSDVAAPGLPQWLNSTCVRPDRFVAGSIAGSRFVPFRTKVVVAVSNESLQPSQTGSSSRIVELTQSQWDSGQVEE
jgi:hypothetical protein